MRSVLLLLTTCLAGSGMVCAQQKPATGLAPNRVQAGALVYQGHCAMCHSILPGATLVGPSLSGEMKGPSAGSVRSIIANGKGRMRGLKGQLTPSDVTNLLSYLKTL